MDDRVEPAAYRTSHAQEALGLAPIAALLFLAALGATGLVDPGDDPSWGLSLINFAPAGGAPRGRSVLGSERLHDDTTCPPKQC